MQMIDYPGQAVITNLQAMGLRPLSSAQTRSLGLEVNDADVVDPLVKVVSWLSTVEHCAVAITTDDNRSVAFTLNHATISGANAGFSYT
jgi:hypothetical protein